MRNHRPQGHAKLACRVRLRLERGRDGRRDHPERHDRRPGEKQEHFRARFNPEGANPGAKMAIGHDPGVFMRDGDEMVVPLDWRQAGNDKPPGTAEG